MHPTPRIPAHLPALLLLLILPATIAAQDIPSTDILVLDRTDLAQADPEPLRVTDRDGYDNQPRFLPDGRLVYTSMEDDGTDIRLHDFETGDSRTLFDIDESLYSPTPMPTSILGKEALSVVRDYGDQNQQLWAFPLDGGEPQVLIERINPVGYHAWTADDELILFVLGEPPTLQRAGPGAEAGTVLAESPGRALARIPVDFWGADAMSFATVTEETAERGYSLVAVGPEGEQREIVQLLPGGQDYAWAPDGSLWMGSGSRLFRWLRGGEWQEVADLAAVGAGAVTRMTWSADGERLAVVVSRE